jgi:predicted outer membrane protein
MNQKMRQEIVKLARELPDELLAEALVFLQTLTQEAQKNQLDNSATIEPSEFDKAMAAYQVISEKYKNALRELAQ